MAISPVGGMIYANQNMQVQATKQADFQSRLEAQNLAATIASNEDQKEIEEIRPTEESYMVDPEKEHEKEKNDEEAGATEEQVLAKEEDNDEKREEDGEEEHILDIKI